MVGGGTQSDFVYMLRLASPTLPLKWAIIRKYYTLKKESTLKRDIIL